MRVITFVLLFNSSAYCVLASGPLQISQNSQHYNCGIGVAHIAINYSGKVMAIHDVRSLFPGEYHDSDAAVPMKSLCDVLRGFFSETKPVRIDIRSLSSRHTPAVLLVQHATSDGSSNSHHYVFLKDVDEDQIFLIDPNDMSRQLVVSKDQLALFWKGEAILLRDGPSFMVLCVTVFLSLLALGFICRTGIYLALQKVRKHAQS
jgi:ABC-type bacteriocin/lantibiotic exporter with double-glycine peptidase domain